MPEDAKHAPSAPKNMRKKCPSRTKHLSAGDAKLTTLPAPIITNGRVPGPVVLPTAYASLPLCGANF